MINRTVSGVGRALRLLPLLVALPLLAVAANCATGLHFEPTAEETETFREEFRPGELLDLRNVNGRVDISAWNQEGAEIVARKVGPSDSALDEIDVEVRRTSEGVRVRTRYPKRRRMWGGKYGSVHYSVRVPEHADLRVETVNGPVEVAGISGEVEAQTVNGTLRLTEHRGSVNAKTVNGRIECALDRLREGEEHSFRTVNGRVELTLGREANGRVDARAVNGRVVMDLADSENLDTPTRRRKTVQVGAGGGECRVRTVNGAIHIANEG